MRIKFLKTKNQFDTIQINWSKLKAMISVCDLNNYEVLGNALLISL